MYVTALPTTVNLGPPGSIWAIEAANLDAINLWIEGKSAPEIARHLTETFGRRVTRSAVIGRLHRMGFARGSRYHHLDVRAGLPTKTPPVRNMPEKPVVERRETLPLPPETAAPENSIPWERLDTLKDEHGRLYKNCRWIYGDPRKGGHRFCSCKIVAGKSWCPEHLKKISQPSARKEAEDAKEATTETV